MAETTIIAWTDRTFNPWMGCTRISPGCLNCYAETLTRNRMGLSLWGPTSRRQVTTDANWRKPPKWDHEAATSGTRLKVFCASLCDVFEDHPVAETTRPRLFDLIRRTPHLDWQLLTKRADRIVDCLPDDWGDEGYPNVWLGVSVEDRKHGGPRIDHLRRIPAVVRFLSCEPLLEDIVPLDLSGIDWVIAGGESGPGYRVMDHGWARRLRDRCRADGVAYLFKQSSAFRTEMGIELDGEVIREFPAQRAAGRAPSR